MFKEISRYIRIDLLSRIVRDESTLIIINVLSDLLTACICLLLFVAAVIYVAMIHAYAQPPVLFRIPEWWLRLVIPYSFAVMSLRCGGSFIQS